ncbi:hypothetical protein BH11MYX1_BH11MYX1_05290 [soil metagenome]
MKNLSLCLLAALGACATEAADNNFSPLDQQSVPNPDGKADAPRACGEGTCAAMLCGYDCTTEGQQCTRTCAATEGREHAFVTATVGGTTIDTRTTPYAPVWDLDDVLVYGCNLWDFSNQTQDGLEIELTELRHSSFIVDPNDPSRYDHKLDVYVARFTGPGSYAAEGLYAANETAPRAYTKDGCSVDVTAAADGGLHGTFACHLGSEAGATELHGEFGCPVDAMSPIFSRWNATP